MHFAQILLPAILLAVCRTHALLEGVVANGGDDFLSTNDATLGMDDAAASIGNQWYRRLETQQAREKLIAQYRFMIAKSLVRLRDACKVFDWLAHEQPQSLFGGQGEQMPGDMRDAPITTERFIQAILNELQTQNLHELAATFARQNSTDPAINVLFYFVNAGSVIQDNRLDALLAGMLYDQCCVTTGGDPSTPCRQRSAEDDNEPMLNKRDNAPPKKARFHAWGGKRNADTKVVIRTPFHSWGGKK